jgi:hypothetical protein
MKSTSLNTRILINTVLGVAAGFWLVGAGQTPLAQNTLYGAKLVGNLFSTCCGWCWCRWCSLPSSSASPTCASITRCTGCGR